MFLFLQLFCSLVFVLISTQLFANALEYLAEEFAISAGVTGSVLASFATALPETVVPLLAIIAGSADRANNEAVTMGAILGAPLMLSTLSTFVMALAAMTHRSRFGKINPEKKGFERDLNFFLMTFAIATIVMFIQVKSFYVRLSTSVFLILLYIFYVMLTFKASKQLVKNGHGVEVTETLFLSKLGFNVNLFSISSQLIFGLLLLIVAAQKFISGIQNMAQTLSCSALILSLLIIPLATELPEKINSIIWVRKNKDTLAFGNITGAMVFQSTLLPAIGILMTSWQPVKTTLIGIVITFIAALWLRFHSSSSGLSIKILFMNGLLYIIFISLVFNASLK